MLKIGPGVELNLNDFHSVVYGNEVISLSESAVDRLNETRLFIDYLLEKNIKVYGLTTGYADLRNCAVLPHQASELSKNIITSHDGGIGDSIDKDIVLGAMFLRAHSLAQGHSGCQVSTLNTLIAMVNAKIIPLIPETGSLGASGDLAFLARLGRAMEGDNVAVYYQNALTDASTALKKEGIPPFVPSAKEGLALTNGTSFMISMAAIAYIREIHELENILAYEGLFLNAIGAVDAAFNESIQQVRRQAGQSQIAKILSEHLKNSPFINYTGTQDDYCIRCLPQIFGPKLESILEQRSKITAEMNAVTDNPLIFKDNEISSDVKPERVISFEGSQWTVLSGGNFHGEIITTISDAICAANVKMILTLERQFTYLLNPKRNGGILPPYLIVDSANTGLLSGYMITQYTANALAQKIAQLGSPTSIFNITSANESEDVVSYGSTAAQRWLEQIELIHQFNTVFLTALTQAYAITRTRLPNTPETDLLSEQMFRLISNESHYQYPILEDNAFEERYKVSSVILKKGVLRECLGVSVTDKFTEKEAPYSPQKYFVRGSDKSKTTFVHQHEGDVL